jgi:hypothetical protein
MGGPARKDELGGASSSGLPDEDDEGDEGDEE